MEESNARRIDYRAIAEMSETPGWKIIEEMMLYDIKFMSGLLSKPKPQKAKEGERPEEPKFITDLHEVGRARGTLANADKYISLVKSSRGKMKLQQGE
jgi:hypothetical protein